MLLAEPPRTAYDLHFRLLGIPVRITPFFWVASVLLGWNLAQGFAAQSQGELSVGVALIIWTAGGVTIDFGARVRPCLGVSLFWRRFRRGAVSLRRPGDSPACAWLQRGRSRGRNRKNKSSFRPPDRWPNCCWQWSWAAIFYVGGFIVPNPAAVSFISLISWNRRHGRLVRRWRLFAFEVSLIFSSVWWALLNLLPIYPLDGGQISREMFNLANPQQGIRYSLILSVVAARPVAAWGFTHDDTFMGIMFAMLAYSSFMTLQAYFGGGRGFGG